MNKLCKIMSIIVIMMMVILTTISVQAYTNEDVVNYITGVHTINGRTLQLSKSNCQRLKIYFEENPVTDAQADEIIAKLNEAKKKLDDSGAFRASQVSDSVKTEVVALIQAAGKIAGLDVEVDTVTETVSIKEIKNGNNIISATSYRQLFGSYTPDQDKNNTTTNSTTNNNTTNNKTINKTVNTNNNSNSGSNTGKKLVYTGNDYSFAIKIIVAIVAVAIVGVVVKKYAK